jgi:hypothetical protein
MLALPLARVAGGRQSPWERCDRAMSRPALASMPRRPRWRARKRCTAPGELCRPKCWGGAVRQQAVEDQQVTGLHGDELHGPGQGVHIRAPGLRPSGAVRRHSAKCAKSCGMHRRPPPSSGVSGKASTPCTFTGNGSVQTRRYCHGREVSGLMRHSRPTRYDLIHNTARGRNSCADHGSTSHRSWLANGPHQSQPRQTTSR